MDINGLSRSTTTDRERTTRRVTALTGGLGLAAVVTAGALTFTLAPTTVTAASPTSTTVSTTTATATTTAQVSTSNQAAVATSGSS